MSHRTGIKCNAELLKTFAKAKENKSAIRLLKIHIANDEELALKIKKDVKRDWKLDFDELIVPEIEPSIPCFLLYRLDTKATDYPGYEWMLISFIPETASIRKKMIYASTKSQLKLEFGASYIKEEYNATQDDEMSLSGYLKNKAFMAAPTPLTPREEEMKELRRAEVKADVSVQSRAAMSSGITCPVSPNALKAIKDMRDGKFNYLQFEIDLEKEEINISKTANINVNELKSQLPTDHARFHLFLFKHSFESDYQESFVFIYSMPGYKCSVKERMMYSSCKAPFVDTIQSGTMGIDIAKKIEVDDPEELSEENLLEELHPKKLLHKQQFAKPAPPSKNRGPRRIIK